MSFIVFISLGGNLGNTLEIFKNSYLEIEKKIGRITAFSNLYQTAAWGKTDQPDFLNQVISLETDLNPEKIMSELSRMHVRVCIHIAYTQTHRYSHTHTQTHTYTGTHAHTYPKS